MMVELRKPIICSWTLPAYIDGQLARGLFAMFASNEPERYAALKAAGFPVLDSSDPTQSLMHNLLERAGGHYVDVGGTKLIAEGKVGIKAGAKPVAYTTTGLRFSDGITLDADAVVWCTGFADSNVRETAVQILGGNLQRDNGSTRQARSVLGAQEIAERLEGTWGIDGEGRFVVCGSGTQNSTTSGLWVAIHSSTDGTRAPWHFKSRLLWLVFFLQPIVIRRSHG
jgi:hypothetical protein